MNAEETLREGNPSEALAALQQQVRDDPSNSKLRVFLFQLLAVEGQWARASTQLAVAGELDSGTLAMVQTYREALRCELLRTEVFAGRRTPLVFGEPGEWVALVLEALRLDAGGNHEQARSHRDRAFEAAPATPGDLDGKEFEWIADADVRLGPMLEAIVAGGYYWIPFENISEIRMEPPADLRDLVWTAAQFSWVNGGQAVGLIPTRYPGSEESDDTAVRMARQTDWKELAPDLHVGRGQRMFATSEAEYPLLDIRSISLSGPSGESSESGSREAT